LRAGRLRHLQTLSDALPIYELFEAKGREEAAKGNRLKDLVPPRDPFITFL